MRSDKCKNVRLHKALILSVSFLHGEDMQAKDSLTRSPHVAGTQVLTDRGDGGSPITAPKK